MNRISALVALGGALLAAFCATAGAAVAAAGPCRGCDVEIVSYRTISGDTLERKRFPGRYVAVLTPPDWPGEPDAEDALSLDEIYFQLDQADRAYQGYMRLFGQEPAGAGLLEIVWVPESYGDRSRSGAKGFEMSASPGRVLFVRWQMRSSELDVLTERGLVHNWDKGYSALLTEAPISHLAWAGAVEAVAYRRQRHQPQLYLEDEVFLTPDEAARLSSRNFAGQYLDRQGFNWRRCLVRGNCGRLAPEQLWTRFHGWVTQHVGPDAFRRSIAFLDEHLATSLPPRGLEAAEDLRLLALSHGARQNLSCFADRARWHLSDAVRAELAARFGDESPLCRDADGDGFAAADGDCDDGRAGVGPGAEELANGRDDNCNGVVDERVVAENVDYPDLASGPGGTLPALWTGRIQDRRDVDTFVVEAGASRRLAVQFCGDRKLLGRLDVGGRTLIQVTSGRTGRCQLMRVDGSGRVEIELTPTDRTKGSYELLVWPSPPNPRRFASTMRVEERPNGRVRFLIPRLDLAAQEIEPKSVRFWVSGQGFVGKRKARPRVDFAWRPPADLEPGEYTVWAQLFRGRHPVSPASEPVLFRYDGR